LNLLDGPSGTFYGYPQCFSIGNLTTSLGNDPEYLKQYAWHTFRDKFSDSWCQDTQNNRPPVLGLPAHSSPIQMQFFGSSDGCGKSDKALPCTYVDSFIATLHGSWDRPIPAGYSIVLIPYNNGKMDVTQMKTLAYVRNFQTECISKNGQNKGCFRPAGVAIKDGIVYFTSDSTGEIMRLEYDSEKDARGSSERIGSLSLSIFLVLFVSIILN
jgi:glucose/arabinose dehydrogenase